MVSRSGWGTKITEKSLWFLEDSSTTYPEHFSACCSIIKGFPVMFHLGYISTTFQGLTFSPLFLGKGSHSSIPTPTPKSPVKPVAQGITKLLLILWGEPHRNKKTLGSGNPLPPGAAQGEKGYLRGRKHKRGPLQTRGQGNAIGAGACEHCGSKRGRGGAGSRHTGEGQEGWTRSHKATWVPPSSRLPFSASAA